MAVFLGCTSAGRVGLLFLWFYVQELPKAQPAVVLVLKRLRRRGNSLKSHPTDWEKPEIEPATPGLQDKKLFCGFSEYKPVPLGWFKICVDFITGIPKGSPKDVFMEKPGIKPATPGLQDIGLSPTPRRHYTAEHLTYYIIYNYDFSNIYELTKMPPFILISSEISFFFSYR